MPNTYNPSNAYPVVVGLHGCNGSGVAYRNTLRNLSDSLDAIIVCPDNNGNQMSGSLSALITDAIAWMEPIYTIDTTAVYLTGFSCNGQETFKHGLNEVYPFRGIIPFNSWLPVVNGTQYDFTSGMPNCICIGTADGNYSNNLVIHNNLVTNGSRTRLNEMPGIPHTTSFATFDAEMMECFRFLDSTHQAILSVKNPQERPVGWEVYPNPFEEDVVIQFREKPVGPVKVIMLDLTGRELQRVNRTAASQLALRLNPGDLPSGVYLIRVENGPHSRTRKVVKY